MSDSKRLGEWLRSLPRSGASPGFSRRVLCQWDRRQQARVPRRRGPAVAIAVVVALAGGWMWSRADHDREVRAQIAALKEETAHLRRRLQQRERSVLHPPPFVEPDEGIDYVVDVGAMVGGTEPRISPRVMFTGGPL